MEKVVDKEGGNPRRQGQPSGMTHQAEYWDWEGEPTSAIQYSQKGHEDYLQYGTAKTQAVCTL